MSHERKPRLRRVVMWTVVIVAALVYLNVWYFNTFFGDQGDHLRGSEFIRVLIREAGVPLLALIALAVVFEKLDRGSGKPDIK